MSNIRFYFQGTEIRDQADSVCLTDWGRKGERWQDLPAALEPAVRAVLNRRRKDAMRARHLRDSFRSSKQAELA